MNCIYEIDNSHAIDLRNINVITHENKAIYISFISGEDYIVQQENGETNDNFLDLYNNLITTWKQINENNN